MASASYDSDVVAWANEQARLIRAGDFAALDLDHIADEVEDVGKSEHRELESCMVLLLAHLLKWQRQPVRRGASWQLTIKAQRTSLARQLRKMPSLRVDLADPEWWEIVWGKAVGQAAAETGASDFPDVCPWRQEQVLDAGFLPA